MNITKFLETALFIEHLRWLLLLFLPKTCKIKDLFFFVQLDNHKFTLIIVRKQT